MPQIEDGLQMLIIPFAQQALGTLNSEVALAIVNPFLQNAEQGFLAKKIKYNLACIDLTAGDVVNLVFAPTDISIAELWLALITTGYLTSPDDPMDQANQLFRLKMWHEAGRTFSNSSGAGKQVEDGVQSLGGGKGIPVTANGGLTIFAFNPAANNMTTGATIVGHIVLYGVWLRE